jgi:ferredoxin-NADP reductase
MAEAKTARVARAATVGHTRLVELEVLTGPLGFVGGQYVIVDSGVVLPSGKLAKRAYSILSADEQQERVQLAVRQIAAGPGSGFLHAVEVGAEVRFSGPWGQFLPDDARPRATWVFATDTGITAALGLVRGHKFAPQRPHARLLWLAEPGEFLPDAMVAELSPVPVERHAIPPVGHPDRIGAARAIVAALDGRPERVFLSGDGAILYPLREQLPLAADEVRLECFFNNPAKKSL